VFVIRDVAAWRPAAVYRVVAVAFGSAYVGGSAAHVVGADVAAAAYSSAACGFFNVSVTWPFVAYFGMLALVVGPARVGSG